MIHSSVGEIRRRLFSLLLRSFLLVILLLLVIFLALTGYILTYQPDVARIQFPFVSILEGYYLGHGSWDGVEIVLKAETFLPMENSLLLDAGQRVIFSGQPDSMWEVGEIYQPSRKDSSFLLRSNGEQVGTLVVVDMSSTARLRFAFAILTPLTVVSLVLAAFMVLVAFLLVRRFVNPLADLIFAARQVADGKLDTRISMEGPQDLRSLSESFNEMTLSLEHNDRSRRDLLADIAHELRTPLTVIRGRLEGIVDGVYAADGGQVSLALEQTYLLERLVDDLRTLTLAEAGQLHFESKLVDLSQVAQRTLELFSAEAREKEISLAFESEVDSAFVTADPQRMEQVVGNLVGNCLRYVPRGGRVWLTLEKTDGQVELCVNDNGPGVAAEDLPYLFDRFWRKDRSRARSAGGSGLGLAITKQLVHSQGGTIAACNLPQGGLQVSMAFKA